MRRDLEALGVLEASAIDALLGIAPADMTDEQLEVAMALCKRQVALWDDADEKRVGEIDPGAIEEPISD